MKERKYRYFACDFETTVFEGQTSTEVWAAGICELNSENVEVFHSISQFFKHLKSLNDNVICYFHNLKFDGNFILSYLIKDCSFKQGFVALGDDDIHYEKKKEKYLKNHEVIYSISDMGQWYTITTKINNKMIEFRDSLKLLPFTLKKIGISFGTKHKKLDMEYKGLRYAGCDITQEELHYIKNDVLVLKEALEIMQKEGHNKLTIGSCCLEEFKKTFKKSEYEDFFPNLYDYKIDENLYTQSNAGEYIRKSYRGGWCYLAKGKENKLYKNGTTADVNSLYPSMMHSQSGNKYPIGTPTFWHGNSIPIEAQLLSSYYFIRFKTRFYLKKNYLPFVQIKSSLIYKGTESLVTSDYYDKKTDKYYKKYYDEFGELHDTIVELTMTKTDFELFLEHYITEDFEIISGCYFTAVSGIFDQYIDKYKEIKIKSKGAIRELAKLFLNNLYGKMAASTDSSFKMVYEKEDGSLGLKSVPEQAKTPGYIAIGSAITSYARNFTIRAAQANYHGKDKPGFIYADTDSIHCDLSPEEIVGINVHPTDFCCWKLEACWDEGLFVRQKTYLEHVIKEDLETVENPYYNIKCAGMPEKSKQLFLNSVLGTKPDNYDELSEEEKIFIDTKREITDFKLGLIVPGKLLPKRILGGVVLLDTTYEMR